ncbi:hypothetical protein [Streptomyces lydicamycinicus]
MRRLGVDHIDLYQVHYPDTGESLEYAGGGFERCRPTPRRWRSTGRSWPT